MIEGGTGGNLGQGDRSLKQPGGRDLSSAPQFHRRQEMAGEGWARCWKLGETQLVPREGAAGLCPGMAAAAEELR